MSNLGWPSATPPEFGAPDYGQQENRNKEDVQAEYEHITKTIERYQRNHNIILMGDFNAKLKIDKEGCRPTQHQSRNGRFLRNMSKTLDLTVVNKLPEHKDKKKHKKLTTTISDRLHNHQQTTIPPHYRLRDRYKPNLPDQRKKPN